MEEIKKYKAGLIIGKFMPLHKGHVALIEFGCLHAEKVIVLVNSRSDQPIDGKLRYHWVKEYFQNNAQVDVQYLDCDGMPTKEEADREVSKFWANYYKKRFPEVDVMFSSEKYGDYVSEYMRVDHIMFDQARIGQAVSGRKIRENPMQYRSFIPQNIQPYFVKKVAIVGAESTGKTSLIHRLIAHYHTTFVHDIGREMCPDNEACTPTLLVKICERIANLIIEKSKEANKILFLDTDVNITRSYGRFLLNIDIEVPQWIEDVNKSDLYIYLDTDCDLVQDGGRLATQELRNVLASSHKKVLGEKGINYYILNGSREDRFIGSIKLVDKLLSGAKNPDTIALQQSKG